MGAVDRARDDLRAVRPWMARDRLLGTLGSQPVDAGVLRLLGEVHAAMDDLPAADAAWFLTSGPDTEVARAASAAFLGRYRSAVARANALPLHRPLEEYPAAALARLHALRDELGVDGWEPRTGPGRRLGRIALVTAVVSAVVAFLAVRVVGAVTAVRWIWG